jgi:hypothetical protein
MGQSSILKFRKSRQWRDLARSAASSCNWLQLAATGCNWTQAGLTGLTDFEVQSRAIHRDWLQVLQFAASGHRPKRGKRAGRPDRASPKSWGLLHSSGCCNLLQLAASRCNWLQLAATGCKRVRFGATGCDWCEEIWADTQVSPTMYDWVQFAATGCKWA